MKTYELNNIVVNKNIRDVFNIMFTNNNNIVASNVTNIIDLQQLPWETKKGVQRQTDIYTLKIDSLPALYRSFLEDNYNGNVKVHMIKKIAYQTSDKYIVSIKYKIMNLKNIIQTIIEKLQLIRMKCKVYLTKQSENITKLTLKMKTTALIPYSSEIEDYITEYAKQIMNAILTVLQS
jgi:hypothetical protein